MSVNKIVLCGVFLACVTVIIADIPDIEGSPCLHNRLNGTYVLAKHCETLILDYKDKNLPPVCGVKDEEPIICCTSCTHVDDINNIYLTSQHGRIEKRNERSWDACVDNVLNIWQYKCNSTITYDFSKSWHSEWKCHTIAKGSVSPLGGKDTERAEFPFMALLGYGLSKEEAQWLCCGSVLSERYILTAAHCISEPRLGPLKYAALGILKRSDPPEYWQHHSLAEVIPHPDYASPSKYHDIALLKTEKQIEFNINVVPVCLYSGHPAPRRAQALGWGYLGPQARLADVLQKVDLNEFTNEECESQYPPHRHMPDGFDNNTQLCYGDKDAPRDTCQGDSGGPLILHGSEVGCTRALFGVTSTGVDCGDAGAGLYTRVEYYKPWIESIVWP